MSDYLMRLTDIGRAKDANSILAGGQPLDFFEVAVGDGEADPDFSANELQNEVWRGPVTSIEVSTVDPDIIIVGGVIPSDVGGFYIRELGFFDEDGDMIALVKTAETQRLDPALGQLSEQHIAALTKVSNAENVELKADPAIILASRDYVDKRIADLPNFDILWSTR